MIERLEPMTGGRETELDMFEREMEGGVVVIQPPDVHEYHIQNRMGGLVRIEEVVNVCQLRIRPSGDPKG